MRGRAQRAAAVSLALLMMAGVAAATALSAGTHKYRFDDWKGPAIEVRVFVPDDVAPDSPVLMVMHGWSRDAERYFNDWVTVAKQRSFIVVVPHFPVADFETANDYNLGHVFDADSGKIRPREEWTFSVVERLFDDVVARTGSTESEYTIFGHSAGSQFVHRFLYYVPEARVKRFIAANAGWYTMPDFDTKYPYGLKDAAVDEDGLRAAFAKDLVLLLGKEDVNADDPDLRNTREARRQGKNRLARGLTMYYVAKTNAGKMNAPLNWQVILVEGADHSNAKMALPAARLLE